MSSSLKRRVLARALTLAEPSAVADLTLAPADGSIAGRVQDAAGPIAGVRVRVFDPVNGYVAGAVTGADGYYELRGLAAGQYVLQYVDPTEAHRQQWFTGSRWYAGATPVTVTAGRVWASALMG